MFTLPQINILTMSINKILTEYWQEEDLKLVDLILIARMTLTANIDISDRLINSQIDTVLMLKAVNNI